MVERNPRARYAQVPCAVRPRVVAVQHGDASALAAEQLRRRPAAAAIPEYKRVHRCPPPYFATVMREALSRARISGAYIASTVTPGMMNEPALTTRTA